MVDYIVLKEVLVTILGLAFFSFGTILCSLNMYFDYLKERDKLYYAALKEQHQRQQKSEGESSQGPNSEMSLTRPW
jgi:hypothetical protein